MVAPLPVSVLIPAFNRADTLERAVSSAHAQRPAPPAQIIVVDDGSTDGTAQLARGLGVTVIVHERNMGLPAARNSALAATTQPWIALLDADDEWLPGHLAALWPVRDGHVLVAGSAAARSPGGAPDWCIGPVTAAERELVSPAQLAWPENYVLASAALFRSDVAVRVGGFRSSLGVVEDLGLWLRLLDEGTGVALDEVTVVYHIHAGQVSGDARAMWAALFAALEDHAEQPWATGRLVARCRGVEAWDGLRVALRRGQHARVALHGLRILTHPQRIAGAAGRIRRRVRVRRRSARWNAGRGYG